MARVWDDAAQAELQRGLAAPTTQARDLFHLSAAMWDAWAAYDPKADGAIVNEKATAGDVLGRARRGDQLRGVPAPALARVLRREPAPRRSRR